MGRTRSDTLVLVRVVPSGWVTEQAVRLMAISKQLEVPRGSSRTPLLSHGILQKKKVSKQVSR